MVNVKIRPYKHSDYPQVRSVLKNVGLFYEYMDNENLFTEQINTDPNSIFVAEINDQIVGNVILKAAGWGPLLFRLAVLKKFQKQGIGTKLMMVAEQEIIKRGRPEIHLLVEEDRLDLQEFYKRMGYKVGHSYKWMWKSLTKG
jgi:ribosomal protein S18 acetylase RimI-like enzyme